jgi:hypothetical protein
MPIPAVEVEIASRAATPHVLLRFGQQPRALPDRTRSQIARPSRHRRFVVRFLGAADRAGFRIGLDHGWNGPAIDTGLLTGERLDLTT